MGLDITAYHKPALVCAAKDHPILTGEIDDDKAVDDFWDSHVITYLSPHYPHAAEGLETEGVAVDPTSSWTRAYVYNREHASSFGWGPGRTSGTTSSAATSPVSAATRTRTAGRIRTPTGTGRSSSW